MILLNSIKHYFINRLQQSNDTNLRQIIGFAIAKNNPNNILFIRRHWATQTQKH